MKRAADVLVGRPVEITREEARSLEQLSRQMMRLATTQKRGWFLPWLQAQRAAHQVTRRIFERSHAPTSSDS